jgi:hypothetical protein
MTTLYVNLVAKHRLRESEEDTGHKLLKVIKLRDDSGSAE